MSDNERDLSVLRDVTPGTLAQRIILVAQLWAEQQQGQMTLPSRCEDVTFDMRDAHYGESDVRVGDLVWQPKGGQGHVLVTTRLHQEGWEDPWPVPTCECGGVDVLDHHVVVLAAPNRAVVR